MFLKKVNFSLKSLFIIITIISAYFGGVYTSGRQINDADRAFQIMERWGICVIPHNETGRRGDKLFRRWTIETIASPYGRGKPWTDSDFYDSPIDAIISEEKRMLKYSTGSFEGF